MSTILLVFLLVVALIVYGIYRLFKFTLKKTRRAIQDRKRTKEQKRAEREVAEFEGSIARTSIVSRRKVFDSNRKHHYETTFMIYFNNHKKAALTVIDGSYHYDVLMSKIGD